MVHLDKQKIEAFHIKKDAVMAFAGEWMELETVILSEMSIPNVLSDK